MRRVHLSREDFGLFHQDITPVEYEFYRTHAGAFKRMWQEQSRRFWSVFISTFEYFIWNYGVMKDFPIKSDEVQDYVDEILFYIRDQFVDGKASTARNLVMDCVIVTQNRHCIALLDKASYTQNPFYMKETREIFRRLFGSPDSKRTFLKVVCGLPVYIKFAGAAVILLRRWLEAEGIPSDDEAATSDYLDHIHTAKPAERFATRFDLRTLDLKDLKIRPSPAQEPKPRVKERKKKGDEASKTISVKKEKKDEKTKKKIEAAACGEKVSEKTLTADDQVTGQTPEANSKPQEGEGAEVPVKKKRHKKKKKDPTASHKDDSEGELSELACDKLHPQVEKEGGEKPADKASSLMDTEKLEVKLPDKELAESLPKERPVEVPRDTEKEVKVVEEQDAGAVKMESGDDRPEDALARERDQDEEGASARKEKRLHVCALCGEAETIAKSFKRCQKCRGKPNPKYYCSRDCQAKHWKVHKLDHKED